MRNENFKGLTESRISRNEKQNTEDGGKNELIEWMSAGRPKERRNYKLQGRRRNIGRSWKRRKQLSCVVGIGIFLSTTRCEEESFKNIQGKWKWYCTLTDFRTLVRLAWNFSVSHLLLFFHTIFHTYTQAIFNVNFRNRGHIKMCSP